MEVTPQHLSLFAPDIYDKIDTLAQMNPPIRTKDHMEGLWPGIEDGTVDVLGSDHAPHTIEEKKVGYPKSPSGMPGVQTTLPVMLSHMNQGRISLEKIIELLSETPAKLYKLNKGKIKVGFDADLTLIDLNKEMVIKNVSVITMKNNDVLTNQDVVIKNGKITSISGTKNADYKNMFSLEGMGKYIMPSLSDAHVHLPKNENELEKFLTLNLIK